MRRARDLAPPAAAGTKLSATAGTKPAAAGTKAAATEHKTTATARITRRLFRN